MGYYNPVYCYGIEAFARDAAKAGVDGVIIVDVPPEEDAECAPALAAQGLALIRLIAPTTPAERLPLVTRSASGFLYYVAVKGITGTQTVDTQTVTGALTALRAHTPLPLAVGFGVKTPQQAAALATSAEAVVVGSGIVERMDGRQTAHDVLAHIAALAAAVHGARP
jgi:tryptophan synthase alpha chain